MWADENYNPEYNEKLSLDLTTIEPSLAGPKRPQDKILLKNVQKNLKNLLIKKFKPDFKIKTANTGDIVIAAITSCTNTSNPNVMIAAGLVAKKLLNLDLKLSHGLKQV